MTSVIRTLTIFATAGITACGGAKIHPWQYAPRPMADTLAIHEPEEQKLPLPYEALHSDILRPIGHAFDWSGTDDAWNVDAFDGVVNSTWFTNRNGISPMTPDEVGRGPRTLDGPAPGPLTVTSVKAEGVTPGFNIQDSAGQRWLVKFDPPENSELASGAEVITTSLFWAAGYNTPENYVFYVDVDDLVLDSDLDVVFPDEEGEPVEYRVGAGGDRELTKEMFVDRILGRYPRRPDGTIRALASRFLEGIPKGPYDYVGTREDDPNDVIKHQHRRELRGMYPMAAWLNHTDAKGGNSLDMFVVTGTATDGTRIGYLKHHLIDFGSTLGSAAAWEHDNRHGVENSLDLNMMGRRLVTLGAYKAHWQKNPSPEVSPATGYYSIDNYDAGDWRPNMPNEAFDNRTPADGYWGAKLVMSFTDEMLEAVVDAADYSNPSDALYVLDGLRQRRDATGRYWFAQVSPLENGRLEGGALRFDDYWIEHFGGTGEYRYEFTWDAPDPNLKIDGTTQQAMIPLPVPPGPVDRDRNPQDDLARVRIWSRAPLGGWSPRPATFWLAWDEASRAYRLIGLRH